MDDMYITLKEFCERTAISPSTAYRMIRQGTLPAKKLAGGRRYKVPLSFLITLRSENNGY